MLAPGPLRKACGFYYQEFTSFKELVLDHPFKVEEAANKIYDWGEYIIPETARAMAWYDHPHFGKYPAITINNFGKGTLLYEGTGVSDGIQEKILLEGLERAGIKMVDQNLHWPLVTKSGVNDGGKKVHYFYNYSSDKSSLVYPHPAGTELVSGNRVTSGASLEIGPWDVLIIEEN